ncbi:MAG: ABC transporter permease [Actinomycetota bacterium]|nr:ABC transporter permease [Actinomycetota bacterium]
MAVEVPRVVERIRLPSLGGRRETRERLLSALQLTPATLFLLAFLVAPLAIFFAYSFWVTRSHVLVADWTLTQYKEGVTEKIWRDLLRNTVVIAITTAGITVTLAYAFAHALRFHLGRHQEALLFLVLVALFSGYLVRIYAWRTILGNEGIVNEGLIRLGLIDQPLSFLLFSRPAAILVLVNFLVPLAILPIYAALQNVRSEEVEAARDLGAGPFAAFRRVTLPLAWSGVFVAFAISFIIAAGDYVTPQLVGGTSGSMIGRAIANQFGVTFEWPRGAALAFLTLAFVLAILAVLRAASARIVR